MNVETQNEEKQINRFDFNRIPGTNETEVVLDLSYDTAELGERLAEVYPEQIKQGSRIDADGRVEYRFRLATHQAQQLETAILEAARKLQMGLEID